MIPTSALRTRNAIFAGAMLISVCMVSAHAEDIKVGGTGAALGTMRLLADAYVKQHADTSVTVLQSIGSSGGIKAALAGAIQIGVSTRPLKDAEKRAGATEVEYGRTPFVFATPAASKASGITTQNLVDIYAGRLETWPDGSKIRLLLRLVGDSDRVATKSISGLRNAETAAEQRKGMLFAVTDQETADNLETIPGALGRTTLALMLSEKRRLKALAFDGVMPSARSIADGSYPLYKQMFLVTGPKPSAAVQGFVAFIRSPAGRDILSQTGHWVKS